jgi:hypothetical protein
LGETRRFWCRRLLEGKIAERGKMNGWGRIAEGELLKLKKGHGTVQICTENFIHRL